jgi:hypothetical protein
MLNMRVIVVAGLACGLSAAGAEAAEGRGRLELQGTNVVALGLYPNTEDRTASVTVRNEGDGPVRIARVVLTCKCMRVGSFPKALGPGESGDVAVIIAKNEVAGLFERVFYIESDGQTNRSIKVRITGYAKPLFLVTCDRPSALGPVDAGTVWTGRFTVAATETGIRLGDPVEQNRGAAGTFNLRTNTLQALIAYEVDRVVTFDGEGLLESALVFPILREDGQKSLPVRVVVEAVRRRPFRVVPDRLVVTPGVGPVRRRMLVTVEAGEPVDAGKFRWESGMESVGISAQPSKSGKGFFVELVFPAESVDELCQSGGTTLSFYYGTWSVEVPVQAGL